MKSKQFQHPLPGGLSLHVHRWLPEGDAHAALIVVHGMAEHGGRYARLAQTLTGDGYAVYALDLPGHGRTARAHDELGHAADQDGWLLSLSAINAVRELAQHQLHDPPVFMLGHSMGSFLLQDYVVDHGHGLAGAIFSATSGDLGPMRRVGLALLHIEEFFGGRQRRSALAEAMSFKDFNRRFKPARTAFDWLSRDVAEVDQYMNDPLCGFRCSCRLWIDLLTAAGNFTSVARLRAIPPQLPVLMIAGGADPVTQGALGPRALERNYRAAGLDQIDVRIYDGARHELLNETCRDEVMRDLHTWLRACRPSAQAANSPSSSAQ